MELSPELKVITEKLTNIITLGQWAGVVLVGGAIAFGRWLDARIDGRISTSAKKAAEDVSASTKRALLKMWSRIIENQSNVDRKLESFSQKLDSFVKEVREARKEDVELYKKTVNATRTALEKTVEIRLQDRKDVQDLKIIVDRIVDKDDDDHHRKNGGVK